MICKHARCTRTATHAVVDPPHPPRAFCHDHAIDIATARLRIANEGAPVMTNHAQARLGSAPAPGFRAALMWSGETVNHAHHAIAVLAAIFPNLPIRLADIKPVDAPDAHGVWTVPVPSEVAAEVAAGVDYAWTEAVPYDFGEGEEIVSIFIPGSPA